MIVKNIVLRYNEKEKGLHIDICDSDMKCNKKEKNCSELLDKVLEYAIKDENFIKMVGGMKVD